MSKMNTDAIEFFFHRYGLTLKDIDDLLAIALARGGDYADLYFEYRVANSVHLEEHIVKSATKSIAQGVGVRVIMGDKTGYAYTDEIAFDAIEKACSTASHIARSGKGIQNLGVNATPNVHNLYPVEAPVSSAELIQKIELMNKGDVAARGRRQDALHRGGAQALRRRAGQPRKAPRDVGARAGDRGVG